MFFVCYKLVMIILLKSLGGLAGVSITGVIFPSIGVWRASKKNKSYNKFCHDNSLQWSYLVYACISCMLKSLLFSFFLLHNGPIERRDLSRANNYTSRNVRILS